MSLTSILILSTHLRLDLLSASSGYSITESQFYYHFSKSVMKFRVVMKQPGLLYCVELLEKNLDMKMKYKELFPPIFLRSEDRGTREDSCKRKLSQNKFRFINQQAARKCSSELGRVSI
jgi:hypothetical protein